MSSSVVAALDIGTSSVRMIVGTIDNRQAIVLGYGKSPSVGFKKGILLEAGACAKSIRSALEQAKGISKVKIDHTYVGFSGGEVTSANVITSLQLPEKNKAITPADITMINGKCRSKININNRCIHIIPREFAVDGYWGAGRPVGMKASRLDMDAHTVLGQQSFLQSLHQALALAGIAPKEIFYTPLVVADQVLTTADKEIGTILLDIGGTNTDLCWYHRGKPWLTTFYPVGSEHITSDLAIGLRIPTAIANQIKIDYGVDQYLPANQSTTLPTSSIKEIIAARLLEITDLIKATIANYGRGITPGKLVLVGGGAKTKGLANFITKQLNLPVDTLKDDYYLDKPVGTVKAILNYSLTRKQQEHIQCSTFTAKLKNKFKNTIDKLNS